MRETHVDELQFSIDIRNKALNRAYREQSYTNDNVYYLEIADSQINQPVIFTQASNGKLKNASNIMFAIPSGTVVDQINIYSGEGFGVLLDYVELEDEEIKTFTNVGTYTIVNLSITMKGTL